MSDGYRILERIGEGGMGTVFRGVQCALDREVAIKVIRPAVEDDTVALKRFLREAKLASGIRHPNIVTIYDFYQTDDGELLLVMELLRGHTLDQVLHAEGPLLPGRIAHIGAQICDALDAAHARQVIHRDLKPANVMLLERDTVKVLDFGLAKSLAMTPNTSTTRAGVLVGTPAYMPPESCTHDFVDERGDLYSLGCILYELATGHLPFRGVTAHEQIANHLYVPLPPLTSIPRRLASTIERLLAKSPADRFQSAAETRRALEISFAVPRGSGGFASTLPGVGGAALDDTAREPPFESTLTDLTDPTVVAPRPRRIIRLGWDPVVSGPDPDPDPDPDPATTSTTVQRRPRAAARAVPLPSPPAAPGAPLPPATPARRRISPLAIAVVAAVLLLVIALIATR